MELFSEYALFLAKTFTLLVALLALLVVVAALRSKGRGQGGELQVHKLNEFYQELRQRLQQQVLDKPALKALRKEEERQAKARKKQENDRQRIYVLDFQGDIRASAADSLRHEVTALLSMARPEDEVVVRLESPGGMVHGYGLAASQLARIRQAGIPLTVCVDKVAASGGYMMACIANRVLAAPFAILGSIGVVAQLPNVHRLLKRHDIDFEVLTAGQYKRTLTVFGENTEQGREKFQQDLETTHALFKAFVASYRPQLNIEAIATGEVWLGQDALARQLVDQLGTSDEYLAQRANEADVYQLHYVQRKSLSERVGLAAAGSVDGLLLKAWERLNQARFWH